MAARMAARMAAAMREADTARMESPDHQNAPPRPGSKAQVARMAAKVAAPILEADTVRTQSLDHENALPRPERAAGAGPTGPTETTAGTGTKSLAGAVAVRAALARADARRGRATNLVTARRAA